MHTKALFQAALGLAAPWFVSSVEFDAEAQEGRGRLDVRIDFERGGKLPCPECGAACPAHDADEQSWRHLDFFQHVAYLTARVPRVRCEKHGVHRTQVPWARPGSGFTLLFEALVMAFARQMPMSAAFQKGAAEALPFANITFDRFHVMKLVGEAVDDARRREVRLAPGLLGTRVDWLLNPSRLSGKRQERVERLSQRNLLTAKAYQMRLNLKELWELRSVSAARRYLVKWCTWARRTAAWPEADVPWILEKMHTSAVTTYSGR